MSIFRPGLFRGSAAVVTGGAGGIGKAITNELLHLGCNVVIASRKEEHLKKVADDLNASNSDATSDATVTPFVCDIRDEAQVQNLMAFCVKSFGGLDLLVCNAGGQFPSPAAHMKSSGWRAVVDTNLTGTFLCCREALAAGLGQRGPAAVVNIIADMFNGFPGMSHTGAARAGVDNLTKSLALEWAASGVRVNAVAPGVVFSESAAANYPDGFLASFAGDLPAQRLGTPEEVANAVCFLLSPGARYVSGTTLRVDGASSLYKRVGFNVPAHNALPPYEI